jgi:hypothetical protein
MKLYRLLWHLLGLALRGRLRHDVLVSVLLDTPERELGLTGVVTGFDVLERREGFFIINAVSEDPDPWCEYPSIGDLIEASSLGTPGAKALRESVPDEVVDRIMARAREIEAEEASLREIEEIKRRYLAREFTEAEAVAQICRALPGCIPDGARSLLPPRRHADH